MFDYKKVMEEIVAEAIETGVIAGANVLLLHQGKEIYGSCQGYADKENKVPMKMDTIFRMFSMSKPVTAVAAMMLAERGKIDLWDKVSKYIPEFETMYVMTAEEERVPAKREITIWDLLNMTSGIPYPGLDTPGGREMAALFDEMDKETGAGRHPSTLELCRRVSKRPLVFHPGETWGYGLSADILGGVIEVASGKSFGAFLEEELFRPLGMEDTGFFVPKDKWDRFAVNYQWNGELGTLVPNRGRHLGLGDYTESVNFESGGAGLVSTISDYSKFAQMMLNGGTLGNARILGRKTVEMMTRDQLTEAQRSAYNWENLKGYGYGCLMRVMMDNGAAGSNASLGEFGWDGWTGNYVIMDRSENFALLYFIQKCDSGTTAEVRRLRMAAYAAIE